MSNLQNIIAKVQKLTALANNNTNLHEAESARAAADKLIQEYRLSQQQLESENLIAKEAIVMREIYQGGKRSSWRERILHSLAAHYGCAFYTIHSSSRVRQGGEINVDTGRETGSEVKEERNCIYQGVGRESDLTILEYMFSFICGELERIGKIQTKGQGMSRGEIISFAKSWYEGAAVGVCEQFKKLRQEQKIQFGATSAMVLLENRELDARRFMYSAVNLKRAGACKGSTGGSGFSQGYTTGKNLSIQKGLSGTSDSPKLNK